MSIWVVLDLLDEFYRNGCFLDKVSVCSSTAERSCEAILACSAAQSFCHVPLGEETHVRDRDGPTVRAPGGARVAILVSGRSAQVSLVCISQ